MNLTTPKGWRKGQTLFNFLAWLERDPFYIPDKELDELYAEFLKQYETLRNT